MNQYLFGLEVRYICPCGGVAYEIRDVLCARWNFNSRESIGPDCTLNLLKCTLCNPNWAGGPGRYYLRWK